MAKCSTMSIISAYTLLTIGIMTIIEETKAENDTSISAEIPSNRIMGGFITEAAKVPYYVYIQTHVNDKTGKCGGSIISANWVLTAAHCVVEDRKIIPASGFLLYAAKNEISINDDFVQIRHVKHIVIHKAWSNPNKKWFAPTVFGYPGVPYDIAILKTKDDWNFSSKVSPISLIPMNSVLLDGTVAIAYGFGLTESGEPSKNLQAVRLRKVSCTVNPTTHICFTGLSPNASTAPGDSGGPLVFSSRTKSFLIGLTSGGNARTNVFTDLSLFRNWIRTITGI